MILTSVVANDHNKQIVKTWLERNCPLWQQFHIHNRGKYLGLFIGPEAGQVQWDAALTKCKARVLEVKTSSPPLAMLGNQFASKAISVLGYVGQLATLPKGFKTFELWAAHKVLGMPLALGTLAIFNLGYFNNVKLVRPSNYLKACMCRAAMTTVKDFVSMHKELKELAIEGTPLGQSWDNVRPPG